MGQLALSTILVLPDVAAVNNPPVAACGLDIVLVMDSSNSILGTVVLDQGIPVIVNGETVPIDPVAPSSQFGQLQGALNSFVTAFLPATPSLFALVEFNTQGVERFGLTDDVAAITSAISSPRQLNAPVDGINAGFTNYDDALKIAREIFENDLAERDNRPNLIVFASDGVPTVSGHPGTIDFGEGPPQLTEEWLNELEDGIDEANAAKTAGARILAFGIEIGAPGVPGFRLREFALENIASADAVVTTDFATLGADLAQLAADLCGGTVTVNKLIDADGDLGTPGDQTPADETNPVTFDATTDLGQLVDSQLATGSDGAAVFDIDGLTGTANVSITEQGQPIAASCTVDGQSTGSFSGSAVTGIQVGPQDIVSCTFVNAAPVGTGTLMVTKQFVDNTLLPIASPTAQITMNFSNVESPILDGESVQMDFPDGDTVVVFEDVAGLPGDYSQTFNCVGLGDITLVTGGFPVDIVGETTIECTLTNTRLGATLTVIKDTDPDDASEWAITVNGVSAGSALQDEGTPDGESLTVTVPAGVALTIEENGTGGQQQNDAYTSSFACNDPATTSDTGRTISLPALSEDVTCIFTNTLIQTTDGSIKVAKDFVDNTDILALRADGTATATLFIASEPFSGIGDGGMTPVRTFDTATSPKVLISETFDSTQWERTGLVDCVLESDGSPATVERTELPFDVVLVAGDTVICTFTNTRLSATLHVLKTVVNDDGSTWQIAINGQDVGNPIGNGGATGGTLVPQTPIWPSRRPARPRNQRRTVASSAGSRGPGRASGPSK